MRNSMPTPESVLALMGAVAMEKEDLTQTYPIYNSTGIEMLKPKINHNSQPYANYDKIECYD